VQQGVRLPQHVPGSCPLFKAFVLRGATPLRLRDSNCFSSNVAGDRGVTTLVASLGGATSYVTRGIRPTAAEGIHFVPLVAFPVASTRR